MNVQLIKDLYDGGIGIEDIAIDLGISVEEVEAVVGRETFKSRIKRFRESVPQKPVRSQEMEGRLDELGKGIQGLESSQKPEQIAYELNVPVERVLESLYRLGRMSFPEALKYYSENVDKDVVFVDDAFESRRKVLDILYTREGMSISKIGKGIGKHHSIVGKWLEEARIETRDFKHTATKREKPEDRIMACEDDLDQESVLEHFVYDTLYTGYQLNIMTIAEGLDVSYHQARKCLKDHGIKMRNSQGKYDFDKPERNYSKIPYK